MANKQKLTVAEAATLSGKSAHALRRALRSGVLRGSEVQGRKTVEWRIGGADLER